MQPYLPVWKALNLFLVGNPAGASQVMKEAAGNVPIDETDIYFGPIILALVSEIELAHGDYEEVLRITERADVKLSAANISIFLPDLRTYQGCARIGLGQPEAGLRLFEAALEEARRQGSRRSQWPVLAELVQLASQRGNADQAEILRREGREVVKYIASHIQSDELRASFLGLPRVQRLIEE
jgi:hypothetical protein